MSAPTKITAFVLFIALVVSARADTWSLTTNDGSSLGKVNTVTAAGSVVGSFGTYGTYGAAFDTNGDLFATPYTTQLGLINQSTGAVTTIGSFGGGVGAYAIEIDSSGTAYIAGFDGHLYTVNKLTGLASMVGAGVIPAAIMDLAFDSANNLYGTVGNILYSINTTTGAAAYVSTISKGEIMALAFDSSDSLFAISYSGVGELYQVDIPTGNATFVGNTGLYYAHGGDIQTEIVPDSVSSIGLVAASLAGLIALYRRRAA